MELVEGSTVEAFDPTGGESDIVIGLSAREPLREGSRSLPRLVSEGINVLKSRLVSCFGLLLPCDGLGDLGGVRSERWWLRGGG